MVGLISLLIPAIPFICIGALVFGPIELVFGLIGQQGGSLPLVPMEVQIPGQASPVEVTSQRSGDLQVVRVRVVTRPPAGHIVEASYDHTIASVTLDGQPFGTMKRGYLRKGARDVNVPLDGSGKTLTVRFWGRMMPQIDLLLDGAVIGRF